MSFDIRDHLAPLDARAACQSCGALRHVLLQHVVKVFGRFVMWRVCFTCNEREERA